MTNIEILNKHDIKLNVDAIVNPISKNLLQNADTKESENIELTTEHNLSAKYLINMVVPIFDNSNKSNEEDILKTCYINLLKFAKENNIKSIALPLQTYCHRCNKLTIETINEFITENSCFDNIIFFDIDIQILKEFSNMVDKNLRCQMLPILEPTDIEQDNYWTKSAREFASKLSYLNLEVKDNYMSIIAENRLDYKPTSELTRDEILALLTGYIQHDRISGGLFNSNIKSGKIKDLVLHLREITKM